MLSTGELFIAILRHPVFRSVRGEFMGEFLRESCAKAFKSFRLPLSCPLELWERPSVLMAIGGDGGDDELLPELLPNRCLGGVCARLITSSIRANAS